jgi:Trk K+ transport system NAD-binding subunit
VIVCGLNSLGFRVVEQLTAAGVAAVAVDDAERGATGRRLLRWGVEVIREPSNSAEALHEAGIEGALALIACHDVDLRNLETVLVAAELAPDLRLVARFTNPQLGDQLVAAVPTVRVINLAAAAGPSFVEACIRSDVLHAFAMPGGDRRSGDRRSGGRRGEDEPGGPAAGTGTGGTHGAGPPGAEENGTDENGTGENGTGESRRPETFAVVDVTVTVSGPFRAVYGDLTPVALRRPGQRLAELCPPRDTPISPGDQLALLARLSDFTAHGLRVAGRADAELLASLSAHGGEPAQLRHRRGAWARELLGTVRGELDRPFRLALLAVVAIMVASTTVLTLAYRANDADAPASFSVLDALYLTVATMATVGYGDFNFGSATHWLQAFGIALMLLGALSIAVVYAFITNVIISRRLERALGRGRATAVRDHVVLCGLGAIGVATMEGLLSAGRHVVVIERDENNRFLPVARERGVPVIIGDATVRSTLLEAGLERASTLAALTSDGVANLETVLSAREAHKEIRQLRTERALARQAGGRGYHNRPPRHPAGDTDLRVVLRIYDVALADEVERRFAIHSARSASALATPHFVGEALGFEVISAFYVERSPFLVARMTVRPGGGLDGPTLHELSTGVRVLAVTAVTAPTPAPPSTSTPAGTRATGATGAAGSTEARRANFRPTRHTRLAPGDDLLVVGPVPQIIDTVRRNQQGAAGRPAVR